jgi:hypothetical protein
MSRQIMDGDLRSWEVFVNTGPSGFSRPPRIVFRCASDRSVPSRMIPYEGEPVEALELVDSGPPPELLALLEESRALS